MTEWKAKARNFKLEDYEVSEKLGFLLDDPLEFLPPYFEPWNSLAKELPELLRKHELRDKIHELALLDHTLLNGHKEKVLAHLQLALLSAGYVWGEGLEDIPEQMPSCLAVPLWALSEELDVPPGIGYMNMFLSNFQRVDPERGWELENLRTLYCPTDNTDALNFMILIFRIEIDFGLALKGMEEGIRNLPDDNHEGIICGFKKIQSSLVEMRKTFSRIHGLTDPGKFLENLVPFFSGYGDVTSPLKDGLVFQGVSNKPILFARATGAQTPTIHSLDAFLGLETHLEANQLKMLTRQSIPIAHRKFMETLEAFPSVKDYVDQSSNEELKSAYNELIAELVTFRSYHIRAVAKYAVVPSIKDRQKNNIPRQEGGAYPMPLLKQIRNETREQKCVDKK